MDDKSKLRIKKGILRKTRMHIKWSKKENDFIVYYLTSPSGGFFNTAILNNRFVLGLRENFNNQLHNSIILRNGEMCVFENLSFLDELKSRGYIKESFKCSIQFDLNQIHRLNGFYENEFSEEEKEYFEKVLGIFPPKESK